MGNFWKGVSDEKLLDSEKKLLSFTGYDYEDFDISNVVIDDVGNYARTI